MGKTPHGSEGATPEITEVKVWYATVKYEPFARPHDLSRWDLFWISSFFPLESFTTYSRQRQPKQGCTNQPLFYVSPSHLMQCFPLKEKLFGLGHNHEALWDKPHFLCQPKWICQAELAHGGTWWYLFFLLIPRFSDEPTLWANRSTSQIESI